MITRISFGEMQKDSIRIFWPIGMSFHVSSFLFQCFWKSSRCSSKQLQEPRQSMESFLQLGPVSSPNHHEFMKSYELISYECIYEITFHVICHYWRHFQVVSRCSILRGWNLKVGSTSNGCTFSERWVLCPEILEFRVRSRKALLRYFDVLHVFFHYVFQHVDFSTG